MTSLHKTTCCVLHKNSTSCGAREPNVDYPALLMWIHSDTELQLRTPSQLSSLVLMGGDSKGIHTQPECRSSTRLNSEPYVSAPHSTNSRVCSTWLLGSRTASLCLCWLTAGRGVRLVALSPLACSHSEDFVMLAFHRDAGLAQTPCSTSTVFPSLLPSSYSEHCQREAFWVFLFLVPTLSTVSVRLFESSSSLSQLWALSIRGSH